jgi:hypothetical protein
MRWTCRCPLNSAFASAYTWIATHIPAFCMNVESSGSCLYYLTSKLSTYFKVATRFDSDLGHSRTQGLTRYDIRQVYVPSQVQSSIIVTLHRSANREPGPHPWRGPSAAASSREGALRRAHDGIPSTVITAATAEPPDEQHDRVTASGEDRDEIADAEGTVRVDKNLLALRPRVGAHGRTVDAMSGMSGLD